MPRRRRDVAPNSVVHVVNRGVERRELFSGSQDYDEFLGLLDRTRARVPVQVLSYVLMPNHWHLVLWPDTCAELSQFLHYLTTLHAARLRHRSRTIGLGHVYQGRFRTSEVATDRRYAHTIRYVEANPLRANLVQRAEDWRWSSLTERVGTLRRIVDGPVRLAPSSEWVAIVNARRGT
jgi:putative transposase